MKIVADSHIPFINEYFGQYGELVLAPGRAIDQAQIKEADILLVRSVTHVDKALLADTRVKFVGSVTAGADHLDTTWLEQAGIKWCVATGFNAPPVADYVVSVIAILQKKQLLATKGAKAAVIGVGNVGALVAERLKALHFDVITCDPLRAEKENAFFSVPTDELTDLDFISLHVPLTKTGQYPTYHFIDKHFLQRQKPGCILLNASRGAVINTNELMAYGTHLHWCLDVWEHEPKIDKAVLTQAFIATPHIAGYSVQSKIRGIDMIYRLACAHHIIEPQSRSPLIIPQQQLTFTDGHLHWQDIVLGIFNPEVITTMMRTILLPATEQGLLFDEMRNQFNYRYEFGFTTVRHEKMALQDRMMLEALGIQVG